MAQALQVMVDDVGMAQRLGRAAYDDYQSKDIRWDRVVEALTGLRPTLDAALLNHNEDHKVEETLAPAEATEAAVKALEAAIVSKVPAGLLFNSISEVFDAYDLGLDGAPEERTQVNRDKGLVPYLVTHWQRYLNTLHHVERLRPTDVLDVGIFPPLVFEAMMVATIEGVILKGIWEGPDPIRATYKSRMERYPHIPIEIRPANVEKDRLPYADGSFDLVVAMEIFEHLALDPHFFLSEACRILRPGGHVLITTPNICSHRGVQKMLSNEAPTLLAYLCHLEAFMAATTGSMPQENLRSLVGPRDLRQNSWGHQMFTTR